MIGRKETAEWRELLDTGSPAVISKMTSLYGEDRALVDERRGSLASLSREFERICGAGTEVGFARAPGRLNTLSMHTDHRGSFINPIALTREVTVCYSPRNDDTITVHNTDPAYGTRSFRISEELPRCPITSIAGWLSWTQEETDRRTAGETNQDWVNKLKSIPVYLGATGRGAPLRGFDAVVSSTIPARMGLSSSSAIVVAMLDILADVNGLALSDDEFVRCCGVAEWYVGTRGGAGDHAAIKLGRPGRITHMKTTPRLEVASYLPFPEGCRLIIFDSGHEADKTGPAGHKFNEKTATYEIGEIFVREYLKKHHRGVFDHVASRRSGLEEGAKRFYLSDIPECLDWPQVHEMLHQMPGRMDRAELLRGLPEHGDLLKAQFATHPEPEDGYRIQPVLLYGIAESERGRMLEEVLGKGDVGLYGRLMYVSHDGDRVSFPTPEAGQEACRLDPGKPLHLHAGAYGCSTPEIDEMVDLAREAGALGAQISGAGLGGSIMALVKTESTPRVIRALAAGYYHARGIKENYLVASAAAGACLL